MRAIVFSTEIGLQWVRQSACHCTTEAMTKHNHQSSIKRIYMTLKFMCVFLLFPLCFFSWRPIKNDTVTPYNLFDKDSVTLYVFYHDDQRKTTVLPPMFYFINIDSVTPYVYFMTADKKQQSYPSCFSMLTNKKQQRYPWRRFFGDPNLSCLDLRN